MPTLRTPLAGSYNNRSTTASDMAKGQFFKGCIFNSITNAQTNTKTVYVEKRNGYIPNVGLGGTGAKGSGIFISPFNGYTYPAFDLAGVSTLYFYGPSTNGTCGVFSGFFPAFTEVVFSNIGYLLFTTSDQTGWYVASDSMSQTSYTVTTHTNTTVDGIASTAGMYAGQSVTKADFQAGTRIASVDSANQITITLAATGSSSGTLTKTPLAKIISANFPTDSTGAFVELDGTIYIMTQSCNVRGSDLNSVSSWSASNSIPANAVTDVGIGLAKYNNHIVAFGTQSAEFFYNAGNPAGSLLSSRPQYLCLVGAYNNQQAGSISKSLIATGLNYLAWVSPAQELYLMDNFQAKKISQQFLAFGTNGTQTTLDILLYAGKTIIHMGATSQSPNVKWYIIEEGSFVEPGFGTTVYMSSGIDFNGVYKIALVNRGATGTGDTGMQVSTAYLDNGSAFTMSIQIGTDMGTNFRKFIKEMRVEADVQSSGNLQVSYSDNDGATYSAVRNIPMTSTRMRLPRLGSFVGTRLWKFEHSDNTACRIKSVEFDYEIGKR